MTKDLAIEIDAITSKLQVCKENDEMKEELVKMVKTVELMNTHFEFILAILGTNSEEDVKVLKEKFSLVEWAYENVKTKDDLTETAAKIALGTIHDKMFIELKKISKRCFGTNKNGEVKMIKKEDNLALIKIMVSSF